MIKKLLLLSILGIVTYNSFGQLLRPVRWRWKVERINDNEYKMIFTARIQDTWSLYSQHIGDGGPVPTSFTFDKGDHYQLIGEMVESDNVEEVHDKVFDMQIKKFHHKATFTQKIKVLDKSKPVTGYLTFMTCDDTRCLPPFDIDFKFDFARWDRAFNVHEPLKKKEGSETTKFKKLSKGKSIRLKDHSGDDEQKEIILDDNKINNDDSKNFGVKDKGKTDNIGSENKDRGNKIPVKWKFEVDNITGTESILRFIATMDKGWDVYSIYTEDNGPIPTSINFEEKAGIEPLGKPTEKGHFKEGKDPMFGVVVKKFLSDQPYIIEQRVKVIDKTKPLKGYISYQTCDDERCIFLEKNFAFDLITGKAISKNGSNQQNSNIVSKNGLQGTSPNLKYNFDKTNIETECGTIEEAKDSNKYSSWWVIFLAGFVGGLFAFLTPCVFPMVPLTVSFFTKRSGSRSKGIRNAIYYGLSIIAIYVIMGLLVTGLFGADALNQLSTNAWFNISFAILFIVFAISFFGYFEITLPSSWANKSDTMANRGGMIGIFFMAFTLALVSFSCTGPIIGTLLVQTATGGGPTIFGNIPAGPLFGMLGFSTALALPFALFAMFPAWLNSLPKSGSWMNTIKVTLGFIEIALALKFISIADLTMGWKIMPYELFVGLWVLISLAMVAYYFGFYRFPLDSPNQKISLIRKILGVVMLLFAIYFATGFRVSERSKTFITPNMLSGLAPPAGHSFIYPKHCPLNINCFHDFDEGIKYAKQVNKPILLDFTGYGCVNCRRMEDNVWSKDEILKLINDNYVLVSLYVDDRKKLDKPYFSEFMDKKMRTVGNKWAEFQGMHFDKISQPYYVLLSPDEKVLNKPHAYTPDVELYKDFLECGIEKFKELQTKK